MTYHLAGDSTVAAERPGQHPLCGWGEMLADYVAEDVRNLAFGGATTESFIETGTWSQLVAEVASGDTVLIQFGHNDQKHPDLLGSRNGFVDRLRRMILEVRAHDARAVLCTSAERRWFDGDVVTPTHGDYPNAVRDLAESEGVPLIDLTVFTSWLYEDMGPFESRGLLSHYQPGQYPAWPEGKDDDTHFQRRGARKIAAFVGRSIRAIERQDGDAPAKGLEIVGGVG